MRGGPVLIHTEVRSIAQFSLFPVCNNCFNPFSDIDISYKPTPKDLEAERKLTSEPGSSTTPSMKDVLNSIPGFSLSKVRKKPNKKLSASAAIQQVREGNVDIESADSILGQVNLRLLLNKGTFQRLPPLYQYKLMQLLPTVDRIVDHKTGALR